MSRLSTSTGLHRSYADGPVRNFFKLLMWSLIGVAILLGVAYFIAMTHWHSITCVVNK